MTLSILSSLAAVALGVVPGALEGIAQAQGLLLILVLAIQQRWGLVGPQGGSMPRPEWEITQSSQPLHQMVAAEVPTVVMQRLPVGLAGEDFQRAVT